MKPKKDDKKEAPPKEGEGMFKTGEKPEAPTLADKILEKEEKAKK